MNPNNQKEPPHSRLQQLRVLSRLRDSAFPLPGGYRIGLDGIIGLIPGFGDIAGSIASSYIIVESARLGASVATLLRMAMNVLVESLVGLVPSRRSVRYYLEGQREERGPHGKAARGRAA